ncbi:hypothetical protein PIB30_051255 [Stylosanthes scabra]|uniref:Remorin C-terminal domain-containing protein n=1 Tax=Stylosanthes scabra TaxID=79078 RepID=A0ABU6ZGN5_9FABA|nr:hypothetical protein [Stylosanthes scabra]
MVFYCRVSFTDPQAPKHHWYGGTRDNNNAWSWFKSTNFHYGDIDDEHATSVAAAAFAIHSLEEEESRNSQKIREGPKSSRTQTMRRKEIISKHPSYGKTSIKSSFGQDSRTKETAFPVRHSSGISSPKSLPPALAAGYQKQKGIPLQQKNVSTRPQTWQKTKIEKIQLRYEKIKSKILSWKCVKRIQTKFQIERKKRALKRKRAMQMVNYRNKMERIDMLSQGSRVKLEDQRRNEEWEAIENSNRIRKTGKVPVKCSCFNPI